MSGGGTTWIVLGRVLRRVIGWWLRKDEVMWLVEQHPLGGVRVVRAEEAYGRNRALLRQGKAPQYALVGIARERAAADELARRVKREMRDGRDTDCG